MHWRSAADEGSVAAEFAVAMPAVLLVLATGLGGISMTGTQLRLQAAAADAARMLGRGEAAGTVNSMVADRVEGAGVIAHHTGRLVCARLSLDVRIGPVPIAVRAEGCALDGGG